MTAASGREFQEILAAQAAKRRTRAHASRRLDAVIDAEQEQWDLWLPVAFGAGIAIYFLLRREPPLWAGLVAVVVAGAMRAALRGGSSIRFLTRVLLWLAVGFAIAAGRSAWVAAPVLTRALGPVAVEGFVELIEPRATRGSRLTLAVTKLGTLDEARWPVRVRIRTLAATPGLSPGDHVRLTATLSPPPGPALPGGFDFARGAWFQQLGAVGFASGAVEVAAAPREPGLAMRARAAIERARQAIGQRILAALPGEAGHIANALITGERGGISAAANDAYRNSGLFHILSISGLHMTIMAGAVFLALRYALAAVPSIALVYPIKKWAAGAAIVAAFAYLLISGSASATIRSWIMITIMLTAVLLDRPALALRNVAVAALIILAIWPESVLDAGFQMSFAAVVALVTVYEEIRRRSEDDARGPERRGALARVLLAGGGILLSTLVAGLAVAPFSIYHFHASQPYAMLANLVAIPICNLIVMPAALVVLVAMAFGLETWPLALMGAGIDGMSAVARWVGGLSGAVWRTAAIPVSAFGLFVAGGLWLCLWRTRWRVLGLAMIALACALATTGTKPDVLVSGQGGLVAVRTAAGNLSALSIKGSGFELARWLEHDGDGRAADDVVSGTGFQCDAIGCGAVVAGKRIAVAAGPAALRDDCVAADVLVVRGSAELPKTCDRNGLLRIAPARLAREGTHAVYVTAAGVRVETVAAWRGERPWSRRADGRTQDRSRERPSPSTSVERLGRNLRISEPVETEEAGEEP